MAQRMHKSKFRCFTQLQTTEYFCPPFGYKRIILNQIFSLAYILLFILGFLNFRHSIIMTSEAVHHHNFQCILHHSKVHHSIPFFNFRVLFKDLSCLGTSHNLHNLEGKYFGQNQHKDVSGHY